MNIFVLDEDPKICAQYHCDKHVVKMCLEYAQLLSTTVRLLKPEACDDTFPYKITHKNHPAAVWARESVENYDWLVNLAIEVGKEYTFRYGKFHKSIEEVVKKLPEIYGKLSHIPMTTRPQCMPDEYRSADVVESYRTYYVCEKSNFATWKVRDIPEWFNASVPPRSSKPYSVTGGNGGSTPSGRAT